MTSQRFSSQGWSILALILLVLIWGYNWVVMKIAIQYAAPFDYAALRVMLGGLTLLLVLVWCGQPLRPKRAAGAAAVGLLQMSCFYGLSTWALVSGGAGKTAVLNYAMPFGYSCWRGSSCASGQPACSGSAFPSGWRVSC